MSDLSDWTAYYRSDEGRFRITGTALKVLETSHRDRVVSSTLGGRPAKALLLDVPFQLGGRVPGSDIIEYALTRIRVRDLPGWPPRQSPQEAAAEGASLKDILLAKAKFVRGSGRVESRLELVVAHHELPIKAWVVGPPEALLKCLEATLNLEGGAGMKLGDLQEMRLVSPERSGTGVRSKGPARGHRPPTVND